MKQIALGLTLTGCALAVAGIAWVYPPAGMIVAGIALAYLGLTVEVGE